MAVARKLLCVLYAMLRTSTPYKIVTTQTTAPRTPRKESVRRRLRPDYTHGDHAPRQLARSWSDIDSGADHTHGDHAPRQLQEVGQTSTPEQTTPTETTLLDNCKKLSDVTLDHAITT